MLPLHVTSPAVSVGATPKPSTTSKKRELLTKRSAAGMTTKKKPRRTRARKDLHILCYEHHIEMKLGRVLLKLRGKPAEALVYACPEPGCLVHYQNLRGYFIVIQEANTIERDMVPRVRCSNDGQLMYLAEVRPERKGFRLWKCPKCNTSRSNQEISPT
jgi:hypothetical protein